MFEWQAKMTHSSLRYASIANRLEGLRSSWLPRPSSLISFPGRADHSMEVLKLCVVVNASGAAAAVSAIYGVPPRLSGVRPLPQAGGERKLRRA